MSVRSRMQRLFCDSPLANGEAIAATPAQAHYLLNVLRLKQGDEILMFNGQDGEWQARLQIESRKRTLLLPFQLTQAQPETSDLLYCFAPLKTGRLDYMVQKATEMGAGRLQPVQTQHTQQTRVSEDRMRANVIEAAEQCGILTIPSVEPTVHLRDLLAGWDSQRALIFCDEAAGACNPLAALQALRGRPAGLLVGPEGGFSASERETLLQRPFVTAISLGPRILRADTASVAALAIYQAAAGDW